MKTIKGKKIMLLFAVMGLASASAVKAQDKVEASVGADLVSGYIWRGQDLGGVSVQPGASISYKGLSLSAWGSVGFEGTDTKEFDLTLSYQYGGFSIGVTDYWFTNSSAPARYSDYKEAPSSPSCPFRGCPLHNQTHPLLPLSFHSVQNL